MIGKITALYAGLLALLLVALSIGVIRLRWRYRQGLGDGGHRALARSVRVHGNFIEYAPLGLILVGLLELAGVPAWMVHALGMALVLGRVAHGWGLSQSDGPSVGRAIGMFLTFAVLILDREANAMGRAREYGELYEALPRDAAQRTMRFWRIRRQTGDVAAA